MNTTLLNNQIAYYNRLKNHYRNSFEKYPNATNNAYLEGYANAIEDILNDLKEAGVIKED